MKLLVTTKANDKLPGWYYGKIYENYDKNEAVWTFIILHGFAKFFRYIYQIWNIYRSRKTWFDKQYIDAYNDGFRNGFIKGINDKNQGQDFIKQIRRKLGTTNN